MFSLHTPHTAIAALVTCRAGASRVHLVTISGAALAYTESGTCRDVTSSTPKQLLQNLKNAWMNDWLVQSPFYSDAILLKVEQCKSSRMGPRVETLEKRQKAGMLGLTIDSKVLPKDDCGDHPRGN